MNSALLVIALSSLIRLCIAALTPLFPDETYYWEWSRHLAPGYFDHPPMIAWVIRLGTLLFGDTAIGVRFGPVLCGSVAGLFICASARRLAGDRAALVAAVVFAAIPLAAAGLILATPDAPLFAAASATVYAIIRAVESVRRSRASLAWWSVAGIALGVALTAKYTAVLLPLGVFIAVLMRRDLRPRLAEHGPYVATAIAFLVFSPVVLWNARHDWISFAFQIQHGLAAVGGSALNRVLEMVGGQVGLVSPIVFVLCVIAVVHALRRADPGVRALLAIASVVVFAFFMYSATKRRVEANWPALAYVPALALLASHASGQRWDRWMRAGIGLSAVLTLVTYVNAFTPVLPVPARRDPAARAHGWNDLTREVDRLHGPRLSISSYRTWVAADRYQEASALAFHLPSRPETFSLNLTTRANQYDLWTTFPRRAYARDAMILVVDDVAGAHPTVEALRPHFERVTQGALVPLTREGDLVKNLRIWQLERWRGTWPMGRLRSRT
jgi:hypothetical protein